MSRTIFSVHLFSFNLKKQSPLSERAQERTEEEPVVAKSKPVSLVSRTLSAKQSASLDSGASYGPGSQGLGRNSVFTSAEKSVRDTVENSSSTSQVLHRGENPFSSSGRPVRVCVRTFKCGRDLVRGIQNQLARTKLAYHNLQISDHLYLEKVFTNLRQK